MISQDNVPSGIQSLHAILTKMDVAISSSSTLDPHNPLDSDLSFLVKAAFDELQLLRLEVAELDFDLNGGHSV